MSEQLPTIATTNLALIPHREAVTRSADDHSDFVAMSGYDGIEFHPLRSRFRMQVERNPEDFDDLITSYHQSFRAETPRTLANCALRGDWAELRRCLPASGLLPRVDTSLDVLAGIQSRQPNKKPLVVYPNTVSDEWPPVDFSQYTRIFSGLLVQPTPELAREWGIVTSEPKLAMAALKQQLASRRMSVCLDLDHWSTRSTDAAGLPPLEVACSQLAMDGLIQEVHIGPNRTDLGSNSATQLKAILAGSLARTRLGDQLQAIKESVPDGRFPYTVIEMTSDQALAGLNPAARTGKSNWEQDLLSIHRDVVLALRSFITTSRVA